MSQHEIRLDFKTLDRERVMADMISEKNGIIQQLATEVQQLRAENGELKGRCGNWRAAAEQMSDTPM